MGMQVKCISAGGSTTFLVPTPIRLVFRADAVVEHLYRALADNIVTKVVNGIIRAELTIIDDPTTGR